MSIIAATLKIMNEYNSNVILPVHNCARVGVVTITWPILNFGSHSHFSKMTSYSLVGQFFCYRMTNYSPQLGEVVIMWRQILGWLSKV